MSITPTDKPPDGDERGAETHSGRVASLWNRARRLFQRFVDGARAVATGETASGNDAAPGDPDHSSSAGRTVAASTAGPGSYPGLENLPDRERPLTYPGREASDSNTPDVVSVETDRGLRISVPENSEATLVSDVWTSVDP